MNTSRSNTPHFLADRYADARPLYPSDIFRTLLRALGDRNPIFLDLGCGAGQSARSFLERGRGSTGFAIDPDPAMISAARSLLAAYPSVEFAVGRAEAIPLSTGTVDLVLVGSAIHWFDLKRAQAEIERVLKPNGILFVFEYQFPRCIDDRELAETVRRRFNLEWKSPIQEPRGTLPELLGPFRDSPEWVFLADDRPEWTEILTLESFLGYVFSQSRYLHTESAAADPVGYRESVGVSFRPYFVAGPRRFDLKPRALAFRRA